MSVEEKPSRKTGVAHFFAAAGYSAAGLAEVLADGRDLAAFFARAPALNPAREQVTGVICGVRIEAIEDPLMREIRILDKLVDELAKGRPLEKILRRGAG